MTQLPTDTAIRERIQCNTDCSIWAHQRNEWLDVAARATHQEHKRQCGHVIRRLVRWQPRQRQPVARAVAGRAAERGKDAAQGALAAINARNVVRALQLMPRAATALQAARVECLHAVRPSPPCILDILCLYRLPLA